MARRPKTIHRTQITRYRFVFLDAEGWVIDVRTAGCANDIEAIGQAARWLPEVVGSDSAIINDGSRTIASYRRGGPIVPRSVG
jgi:hypothetical protein